MRPKVAVVGLNHGYALARSIAASNSLELAALCTRHPANHQPKAAQLGVPLFDHVDTLLTQLDLDGVAVAVSTDQLVPVAKRCLEHNVSVLLEKPGGVSVANVLDLKRLADQSAARVVVGYYRRLARQVIALEELLTSGVIGDVVGVSAKWAIRKPDQYFKGWKAQQGSGGGCLMINVIHDVDMLQQLFGPIETVAALESHAQSAGDLEHAVALSMKFARGPLATVFFCDLSPSPYSYENTVLSDPKFPSYPADTHYFFGTRGSLAFPSFTLHSPGSPTSSWLEPLRVTIASTANDLIDDPIAAEVERFSQVLRAQEEPHATLDDAIRNLTVVEAIRRSLARGTVQRIEYPLENPKLRITDVSSA